MISFKHRLAATDAINKTTGIVVVESAYVDDVGFGLEAWIHEIAHFLLLRGSLVLELNGSLDDREYFVSNAIDAAKLSKGRAGKAWGVDQELKTLAVESLVAESIGFKIDTFSLALYAVENGNLKPRWKMNGPTREWESAEKVVKEVEILRSSPEVLEAAAYLSRAIWSYAP